MIRSLRFALLVGFALVMPVTGSAQDTRPATTTIYGDTGLWWLPTAEILPARKVSASAYRTNYDRQQGFTDISNFLGSVAVGVRDRVELFGSFRVVTRVDRDLRPLFTSDPDVGGFVQDVPFVHEGWIGNKVGDLYLGGKLNLLAEHRQQPVAFALRGMVKVPTGDKDAGASTGKADVLIDAIVSKELAQRVELAGSGGFVFRVDPDDVDLSNSFRFGIGAGFPSRRPLRITTELRGELQMDDQLAGRPSGLGPSASANKNFVDAGVGVTWQHSSGFFAGAGLGWVMNVRDRDRFGAPYGDVTADSLGIQARLGYHPGARVYVPPPPPPPTPPPPPPPPPPAHTLTVKAAANPSVVEVGRTSTVTATAMDSIGCTLTYRWTAPTGTFANPAQAQTIWTAPNQEGSVPVTVTVTCPTDKLTAADTVTIQVLRPAPRTYTFEDVHFDFDRYSLRPDATRILDEAIVAMKETSTLRLTVEGHTCNIGTAEYNMALGQRRADAVREYLTSRGIGADRLNTVSYGEEMPRYSNDREETRRLNRRAALTVRLQ
jgi:outer membrane protein OmpA-like peptidoglycan-associated protein